MQNSKACKVTLTKDWDNKIWNSTCSGWHTWSWKKEIDDKMKSTETKLHAYENRLLKIENQFSKTNTVKYMKEKINDLEVKLDKVGVNPLDNTDS